MQLSLALPRPSLSHTEMFKDLLAHCCGGSPILGVVKCRFNSGHVKNTYNATVVMFDGRKALVRIVDHRTGYQPDKPVELTWVRLSGGAVKLVGGKWRRVAKVAA